MSQTKTISPIAAGFLFAIGSAALFAIRPVFVKLVYAQGVDSTTLIALRMLFSVPIYLLLLAYFMRSSERRSRLTIKNILQIAGVGMLGYYAASFIDLLGLQYVTAQLGRMILYTYPTFVVLIGAAFFDKAITLRTVFSLILTYLGIAVIFGHDLTAFGPDVIKGALFITASAIIFSFYLLNSKSLIEEVGSRVFTCIALIGASIGIFIHFFITHSFAIEANNRALGLIFLIAIFCTVIPTFFTTAAVARIGADRTGIIATVGPAFTSLFAVIILSESFTVFHVVGILLTILGVFILNRE
ncbi:MAG: DMT family transporter [Acidiferrobacterales bacterium]|nr:DMT family transporter [Acidiferrobacterales bacterium]